MTDVPGLTALHVAADLAAHGGGGAADADVTGSDVTTVWSLPRFDPARDALVLVDTAGGIAGYCWCWPLDPADLQGELVVRPAAPAGTAAWLLAAVEGQASRVATAAGGRSVKLGFYGDVVAHARTELLRTAGYRRVRRSYRMAIDPAAVEEKPRWPPGVEARALRVDGDEVAVHAALEDSFAEHFRYTPEPFADWAAVALAHPSFDPSLWLVARDGAQVAGVLGAFDHGLWGEIDALGVRRPWRGRGLGRALLLASLAEFRRRDRRSVRLYVDAENATGAVGLYERVGMSIWREHWLWQRTIAPAAEPDEA